MKARLYEKYVKEVVPALKEKHKYSNVHQVPRMEKIVVNMGVSASLEKSAVDDAAKDLALITGRKAAISKSRHSIANFKLREGQPIGCRVTLRRDAMYEFFDRLIATALPRIRDFRGLSPAQVRRPRKLHVRRGGPDDFPGDRIGQDQTDAGHGHHDRDQRADGRGGAGFVETDGHAVRRSNGQTEASNAKAMTVTQQNGSSGNSEIT